jgi:putative NIF3 family GTP cyclohydrolase 1 type 2
VVGSLSPTTTVAEFVDRVETRLNTQVRLLAHGPQEIRRVAILSGFGADEIAAAKATGADTYLTGETSHANYWAADDLGLNVLYAGHYATETVGVQALGRHLVGKFGIQTRFLDFPTGM